MASKNKLTTAPYKPSREDAARDRRYRAEDAVRTLTRADEIKKDKGLMRDVKTYAREQKKTLDKVCK